MKKYFPYQITVILMVLACLHLTADATDVSRAQKLEERKEYKLASDILIENLRNDYENVNLSANKLLDFNERLLAKITKMIKTKSPSEVNIQSKIDNISAGDVINIINPFDIGIGKIISILKINKKLSDADRERLKSLHFPLLDKDEARSVLKNFDVLKNGTRILEYKLEHKLKTGNNALDETLDILKKVREYKKHLKIARTNYLSYVVISPYLAEATRCLLLADSDYISLHLKDKDSLDKAVVYLAKPAHKEWLYQTTEEVRKQFLTVHKLLKGVASKVELDDYTVFTTLLDNYDPSKKRGADAWFE